MLSVPTPSLGLGGIPSEWTDACGFVKLPNSHAEWIIRKHGAFEIDLSSEDQKIIPKRGSS